MTVIAALNCSLLDEVSEHEIDTRSGEATCATCGATQQVDSTELADILA